MSSSDFSQWSDLSAISKISRSSGIRPLTRVDSVINSWACPVSSSFREPTVKPAASSKSDRSVDVSKVIKATAACQDSIGEYARLKLTKDCLEETAMISTEPGAQPSTYVTKLNGILVTHEASKYLQLPSATKHVHEGHELTLLGITDLPKIHLTHDEKRDIKAAVENILRKKLFNFTSDYKTLGGTIKEALKSHDSLARMYLSENPEGDSLRWKNQIDEVCSEYYQDLLRCAELLSQWQRLKYINMKELNLRNAENLLLQAQVAETQAELAERMCAMKMYKETPTTVEAFRILSNSLDERILETREKLRSKRALRVTYEDVFTAGYDQVLNKYTELCNVIKKKEHLMEMM